MSSSSAAFSFDHFSSSPSEQLCYVCCNFCDIILVVSVPRSSLFMTATVRCGHCTNLFSVNVRGLLLHEFNQFQLGHPSLSVAHHSLLDEQPCLPASLLMDPTIMNNNTNINNSNSNSNSTIMAPANRGIEDVLRRMPVNRPPEKRQRIPSAYNRFIKDEIQRIKAVNPEITHREAFSAAAKNVQVLKNSLRQQVKEMKEDGDDVLLKDGYYTATAANMRVTQF